MKFTLRTKLAVSYVALGLAITLVSLIGSQYVQHSASAHRTARGDIMRRTAEIASQVSSATEEGFSFVLFGEEEERRRSLRKVDAAAEGARVISASAELTTGEQRQLVTLVADIGQQRVTAARLFEEFERTHVVGPEQYKAYEGAIDRVEAQMDAFRTSVRAESAREALAVERTSGAFTALVGFVAALMAIIGGGILSRRLTAPINALRVAVRDFGAGKLDVALPERTDDEIGELTATFGEMAAATREHIKALRQQAQLRHDIFSSITDALVVSDEAGLILAANATCCRLSGYSEAEIVGKGLTQLFATGMAGARVTAGAPLAVQEEDSVLRAADGRDVPVRMSVSKMQGEERSGWICVARDLAERHRLETALRQAQKMEAVGRLAGGVAHDFNNVLSVILSYSDMLLVDLKPGEPMRGDIEEIRNAGERAARLTRQLLTFSRQQPFEARVIDLNEVLAGMDKMFQRILGADVDLLSLPSGSLGRVRVDPGHMEQVIMNLVVNARDAMPTGGKLTMETANVVLDQGYASRHPGTKSGPHVMLAVTDTGAGMDKATQARIFEPFFTTKEMGKGTGLGLSTVFGIVQQCGGSVWVYSEPGRGTTFKVYLPQVDAAVDAARVSVSPATLRGTETVLLVEDEEQVREVAHGILRANGYDVLVARNGGEALLLSEKHAGRIHLLISDVVMPNMSGPELAIRLGATRSDMRVLCMSGYTDDSVVRHGVVREDLAYLQKPITPHTLTTKVREVLDEGIVTIIQPTAISRGNRVLATG